ncbi:MAG TPA: hypothetical protein PK777_05230 [Thermoguttaceae bacterium]|nr:hypothetical protein [Thermoguttaceae bacterium]HPP52335.1 hypothetical protein [Thermoguttaceae bacterium]
MLATVTDLVARWDQRLLADLAGDTGQPVENLQSNPRILAALQGATGQLRSAILNGRRYSLDDLQHLDEDDAAYLKDLVCALAVLRLAACRVSTIGAEVWEALRKDCQEQLAALERGERIFATPAAQGAGLPQTDGPRWVEYQQLNLLVDRCRGYYPSRATELPLGR